MGTRYGNVIKGTGKCVGVYFSGGCYNKTSRLFFWSIVRGNMSLDPLKSHRDKAKLKWWYKLRSIDITNSFVVRSEIYKAL